MENIKGMKVVILIDNGFEQVEMVEPRLMMFAKCLVA